jgi:2'-hydroxyisoflavone reductase
LLEECGRVTGADTRVAWVPEKFLDACGMRPGELPMRFHGADGLARTSSAKAIAEGLTFRPVGETIRDTLAWDSLHGRRDVGLSPERERELLLAWNQVKEAA